jgi:hypothetical protein
LVDTYSPLDYGPLSINNDFQKDIIIYTNTLFKEIFKQVCHALAYRKRNLEIFRQMKLAFRFSCNSSMNIPDVRQILNKSLTFKPLHQITVALYHQSLEQKHKPLFIINLIGTIILPMSCNDKQMKNETW